MPATQPLDAVTAETETLTAAWHTPRRSRWRAWRARRRAVAAAMDAGYRLSPAAYAHLWKTA